MSPTRDNEMSRRSAVALFLVCLALYHANGGKAHVGVDTLAAPYTAWSIVRHGSLDVSPYADLSEYINKTYFIDSWNNGRVSIRPIGSALVCIPYVAPVALFLDEPPSFVVMGQIGKLTGASCVALATVFFHLLCRRITPGTLWPATILFGFGNCLWSVASQSIWMHGPATLFLTWSLYRLLRSPGGPSFVDALFAGAALGMAVLTRPSTGLFVVSTTLGLLTTNRWRQLVGLLLGGVGPALILLISNRLTHGDWLLGGYREDNWTMPTPLWLGASGLLFAPSRGLFIYSPALLLIPLGFVALYRNNATTGHASTLYERRMILAWVAAVLATIAFFAKWHDWYGGWCFGPRFLCETMPIFCLLFALGYDRLQFSGSKQIGVALVALSVTIHSFGIFGRIAEADWYLTQERPNQGAWLFSPRNTQIATYARASFAKLSHRFAFGRDR